MLSPPTPRVSFDFPFSYCHFSPAFRWPQCRVYAVHYVGCCFFRFFSLWRKRRPVIGKRRACGRPARSGRGAAHFFRLRRDTIFNIYFRPFCMVPAVFIGFLAVRPMYWFYKSVCVFFSSNTRLYHNIVPRAAGYFYSNHLFFFFFFLYLPYVSLGSHVNFVLKLETVFFSFLNFRVPSCLTQALCL